MTLRQVIGIMIELINVGRIAKRTEAVVSNHGGSLPIMFKAHVAMAGW